MATTIIAREAKISSSSNAGLLIVEIDIADVPDLIGQISVVDICAGLEDVPAQVVENLTTEKLAAHIDLATLVNQVGAREILKHISVGDAVDLYRNRDLLDAIGQDAAADHFGLVKEDH